MAGGNIDATGIVALLAFGLSFGTFIVIRLNRDDEIADELTYGDCPHLPEGMRPARKSGGGVSEHGGRAVTGLDRTHDKRPL